MYRVCVALTVPQDSTQRFIIFMLAAQKSLVLIYFQSVCAQ